MYGKVERKYGKIVIASPVFDEYGSTKNTGRIIPIYPLTYQLSQNTLRKIIENAMAEVYGNLPETLPQYVIKTNRLLGINEAIKNNTFSTRTR